MASCANCIHHSLCDYNTNISGNGKIRLVYAEGADVKCSFFQNTADVVPKSEVADLQDALKCEKETNKHLSDEYIALQKALDAYEETSGLKQAKDEVAREIFEELDKRLDKVCIVANRETEYNSFIGVVQQVFDAVGVVLSELKKKYTEGEA